MAWSTLTTYPTTTAVTAAIMNGIGTDLRTWGGNVDGGGNGLTNLASVTGLAASSSKLALNPAGGNVGVGTSAPLNNLVVSNAGAQGLEINPWFLYSASHGAFIAPYDRVGAAWIDLAFGNAGPAQFHVFKANGNVGINCVAPTSPLQVVGYVTYASDAAAGSAGLTAGAHFKDSSGFVHVKL